MLGWRRLVREALPQLADSVTLRVISFINNCWEKSESSPLAVERRGAICDAGNISPRGNSGGIMSALSSKLGVNTAALAIAAAATLVPISAAAQAAPVSQYA